MCMCECKGIWKCCLEAYRSDNLSITKNNNNYSSNNTKKAKIVITKKCIIAEKGDGQNDSTGHYYKGFTLK